MQPVITRSGGSFQVTFKSGAVVQWYDGGFYLNAYATAPGVDYGNTVGLCGNNNGNPNDDVPAYVVDVNQAYLLFPSMVVTAANDLWSWKPTTTVTVPTLPAFAQECSYTAPVVSKPLLSNGGLHNEFFFLFHRI